MVQSDNATEPYDHRGQLRLHEGPHAPEAALCVAAGAKAIPTRAPLYFLSRSPKEVYRVVHK